MSDSAKKVAIYALDASYLSTASMGIYQFTRNLLHALCESAQPEGFIFEIWVTSENRQDLLPEHCPEWISLRVAKGAYHSGLRRLWADHVLARLWCKGVDMVYFPKGWMPLFPRPGTRTFCHLHDAITRYYLEHYPAYGGRRMRYFDFLAAHSVRHADHVFTASEFSARALQKAYGRANSLSVTASGAFNKAELPSGIEKETFLVMGSTRPHKFIPQTLALLDRYALKCGHTLPVRMTGVETFPLDPYPHLQVDCLGRVSADDLRVEMSRAKVLLYLSEVEGFGLPPMEALEMGTPACYRNGSSVAEVMSGAPGGWDGKSEEHFFQALDEAVALKPEEISRLQSELGQRFQWKNVIEDLLSAFRDPPSPLQPSRPQSRRFGNLEVTEFGIKELLGFLDHALSGKEKVSRAICCVNAHIYNLAAKDPVLQQHLNESDVVAADGMSVVWAARLFGLHIPERCNMTDAFHAWLTREDFQEVKVLMMGCRPEVVKAAAAKVEQIQPHCKVVGTHHGYESVAELSDWVARSEKADLILVGMGSPKSESLIHALKQNHAAPVIWHVGGGTLQFLAGEDKEAPLWMRKAGLQWLHRLFRNPKQMAGRYLIGNPLFVWRIFGRCVVPFRRGDCA